MQCTNKTQSNLLQVKIVKLIELRKTNFWTTDKNHKHLCSSLSGFRISSFFLYSTHMKEFKSVKFVKFSVFYDFRGNPL